MPTIHRHPLSWYVEKIEKREHFSFPLFGDGELLMAIGGMTGQTMAFGEVVTEQLCREMREALVLNRPNYFLGTDPNLIDYAHSRETRNLGRSFSNTLTKLGLTHRHWYDGVIWDVAVREGKLGPFLKAVNRHDILLVGNPKLQALPFLRDMTFIPIPETNAYADIDRIAKDVLAYGKPGIYLLCMGLGAPPLIKRLHNIVSDVTLLDLGSTFDIFVGLGAQRGWRGEFYADPVRLNQCISKNLENL
jgi:hypothetical protein